MNALLLFIVNIKTTQLDSDSSFSISSIIKIPMNGVVERMI